MALDQRRTRERKRFTDDDFGDVGEMRPDQLRRQAGTQIGGRGAQQVRMSKLAQQLHLQLDVVRGHRRQPRAQLLG